MATNNATNKTADTFTATTSLATTFDTNVAAAGVTLTGTTLSADGTDANIDININPKATGLVSITNGTANGAYVKTLVSGFSGLLSSADTNIQLALDTLDDIYSTGSWTPAISFGGGTTGITYSARQGFYLTYKSCYFVWGYFQLSSKGTSTGTLTISGFPITSVGDNTIGITRYYNITLTANYYQLTFCTNNSTTTGTIYENGNNNTAAQLTNSSFANNSQFFFNGWIRR